MAIKGNVKIQGGLDVEDAYIKIRINSMSEVMVPVNESAPLTEREYKKQFVLNYNYEFKKSKTSTEPFYHWSDSMKDPDLNGNLYLQAYEDLAGKLNIENVEA